ncbi:uncharacterized protein LOC133895935 isoform X2 [Phragmites australis]|uniref:uncharacterized protein LOC133895935 isoform X2 n=1 Tax=Phragmites australis TaxID=29695 RepID=UPI002D785FA4|nr:uncharacterized protein LOC133895935 isoform X2 [Phragmites australis]
MKKAKVVLAQPATGAPWLPLSSAPGPIRGGGEEAAYRANLRYRGLLHDYQELLKETEARKRRLHLDRLKKQMLLAEVKFLRKRFKSLSENQWQTIVCRVRNPAMPLATRTTAWAEHPSVHAVGSSSKSQPVQPRQDGPPRASPVIDLNEACEQGVAHCRVMRWKWKTTMVTGSLSASARRRSTRWKTMLVPAPAM